MAQTFNTSISFVQSTSRKDRRKGAGSLSVSAFGGGVGNVADSATQAWVRNNFVDKTTEQEISAPKIFSQGIKIGDIAFYKHPDGYVYLDETLVLKGGVVMYGNGSGVEVPSIFESLPIDNYTIKRDGNGALYVDETALSVSGGGGGGVADSVYWINVIGKPSWIGSTKPTYKYSEIEEKPDLSVYAKLSDIPSLNGYATQSWVENKGYLLATTASSTYQPKITSSNKLAYSLISGTPDLSKYFLKSSFTKANIKSTLGISDWALASVKPTYKYSEIGNTPDLSVYALNTDLAKKWTQNDAKIANWDSAYGWGNHANAGYAKASDVTNEFKNYVKLAGDSQSITAQHNFTNGLKIGGLSLRKVDDYLYLDSSLVLSGGVTMYGDDGTTVKPIWESIPFDRTTIDWVNGMWTVVGGVGGGGISEEFLNAKLQGYQPLLSATNKLPYSLISGTPDLSVYALKTDIPTKLSQLTDNVVSGNYLSLVGGTIKGSVEIKNPTANTNFDSAIILNNNSYGAGATYAQVRVRGNGSNTRYGYINFNTNTNAYFAGFEVGKVNGDTVTPLMSLDGNGAVSFAGSITTRSNVYSWANAKTVGHIIAGHNASGNAAPIISTALASGGYGKLAQASDQFGLYAYSASDSTPSIRFALYPEDGEIRIMGNTIPISTTTYNLGSASAKWSNVYATSFIGNLTGNADSATKLATARTIWGNDFDGSAPISGNIIGKVPTWSIISGEQNIIRIATTGTIITPYDKESGWVAIRTGAENTTSGSNEIRLLSSGNVAIGSTTADAKLHVHGNAIINGDLTIPNNNSIKVKSSGGVVYSVLKMSTANSLSIGQESAANGRTTMIYGNLIRLRCGTGGTDALYVNASGNVTIGASDLAGATNKMYVDGTAKFTGDTTFSSKVVIGTIPVYQSADGTLFVDANVVFRGGVAMYGNTTTTINEE